MKPENPGDDREIIVLSAVKALARFGGLCGAFCWFSLRASFALTPLSPVPYVQEHHTQPPSPAQPTLPTLDQQSRKFRMEGLTATIVASMAAGHFEVVKALYEGTAPSDFMAESLRKNWTNTIQRFGPFSTISAMEKDQDQDVIVAYCEFKSGKVRVEIGYSPDLTKIRGIYIKPATEPRGYPESKSGLPAGTQSADPEQQPLPGMTQTWSQLESNKMAPEQQKQFDARMAKWKASGYSLAESPLLAGRDVSKLPPEQREELERANAMMAASMKAQTAADATPVTRPQDTEINRWLAFTDALSAVRGTTAMPSQESIQSLINSHTVDCNRIAQTKFPGPFPSFFRWGSAEENLKFFAALNFLFTSEIQTALQMCNHDKGAPFSVTANPAPGYAMMVSLKGAFTESIAPRNPTLLPGYSEKRNESLLAMNEAMGRLGPAAAKFLPPEIQQELNKLDPAERPRAENAYWEDLQKRDPEQAAQIQKRMLQDPEFQKAIDDYKRTATYLKENNEILFPRDPLAFLKLLRQHEVYVDIYAYKVLAGEERGKERYLAVISSNGGPLREVQLGSAEVIDSAINSFLDAVRGGDDLAPAWKPLQQLLAQPILAALPADTEKVWLSPDATLAFVPFAALLLDMGSSVRVGVVPSPYDFVRIKEGRELPPGEVLFVGNLDYGTGIAPYASMKQTKEEIDALSGDASAAGLRTASLTGTAVTRPVVISRLRGVRFLHFSTHGFLNHDFAGPEAKTMLPGGIALSLANSLAPDSFLNAEDIRHLNLSNVELVTLSACDTGRGTAIEGQGLLGFQTAFMAAGAKSLLFSLWQAPANEATTKFMEAFYEGVWKKHLSKADALRQAQLRVRSDHRFADPRNWATWVLIGEAW